MFNTNKMNKETSFIDYDDLSLYGINVAIDEQNGDVFIYRNNNLILSVTRNDNKIEVRQRINGEIKVVIDEIINKINKYTEFIDNDKLSEVQDEIDEFLYTIICNNGYKTDEMLLYKYDVQTRKKFLAFFSKYVKLRFGAYYKEDLENPLFEEIEKELIFIEPDDEKNKEMSSEIIDVQYFGYTRQKYKKLQKAK